MISGCQQQTTMIIPHTTEQRTFFSKSFKEVSNNPVWGVGVAATFDLGRLCHVFLFRATVLHDVCHLCKSWDVEK